MYRSMLREEEFALIATLPNGTIDLFQKEAKKIFEIGRFSDMGKYHLGCSESIIKEKSAGGFSPRNNFNIPENIFKQSSPFRSPLVVQVELTKRCNLGCKFCFNKAGKPRENEMDTSEIKRVIRELKEEDVCSLFLTGGEPTMHPDFIEIVSHAFDLGLDCFVLTNGTKITPEFLKQIPNRVYFVMSFDGIESHIDSHGELDFGLVKDKFELLKKFDFPFTAQYVLQKINIVDLKKTYKWCGENEIDLAAIDLYPTGRALDNPSLFLTDDDLRKMEYLAKAKFDYEKIQSTWIDNRVDIPNPYFFSFIARLEEIFERTFSGTFFAFIASDGVVYPDNWHAGEGMFSGGNIREQSMSEIWNKGFEEVRTLCRWRNFSCCKDCSHGNYNSCGAPEAHRNLMLRRIELRNEMMGMLSTDKARGRDIW